jgi:formylglycine-generating enzyme
MIAGGLGVIAVVGAAIYASLGRGPAVGPPIAPKSSFNAGQIRANPKDGLTYGWIPPGEFWMGVVPSDGASDENEKPRHKVRISSGFWMSPTLVTVDEYKRFIQDQDIIKMPPPPTFNPGWSKVNHPIVNITWSDAQAYCQWSGRNGRLPWEAEWEYAARAGYEGLTYPRANEITPEDANYRGSKWNGTSPVGLYLPNRWGLFDMVGNVWEWMGDWYDGQYYSTLDATRSAVDPHGPKEPPHGAHYPNDGTGRALRGGSFDMTSRNLRTSNRFWAVPGFRLTIGFRCVTPES